MHWIDALAKWLEEKLKKRGKEVYVFNGGLSVSGLQHVGRLRGEVIIPETVRRILSSKGIKVKQYLTLYTQDAWKGKESQLRAFPNPEEARKYTGWPLIRVPDPYGELSSWVERFWLDFGPYLHEFTDGQIEVVSTTDMYRGKLKEFVKEVLRRRDEVRKVINKYRGRKPYPEGWIPFEPICSRCGRIDTTEATEIDMDNEKVKYQCKHCGNVGWAPITEGKLNWRIEWVGVWWFLGVDFEPYGKDHATPGGSRDSANELAQLFKVEPPEGIPYEWVALRKPNGEEADMSSSDFVGFTPREWIEVAHPEVLRFLMLRTPPMRKISLGLHEVPNYYSLYYKAERIYYGVETTGRPEEELLLKRSYELSYVREQPPDSMPAQPPYTHVAILAQILPEDTWEKEAIKRLQHSGHMPEKPSSFDIRRLLTLLPRAKKWAQLYAPEYMKVRILEQLDENIAKKIPKPYREKLQRLGEVLEALEEWDEERIKEKLIEFTRDWDNKTRREFYKYFYIVLTGKESGPRAAPLLALLDKNFVIDRLKSIK
ncbi:lysine--tRNA ligase [Pyrofollis japonicus]|uniref:lysine--tRNA ligase n=1 Tax=Pyrofollis japonicus TaxID=3060460 RepID=UPI00295B676A|nr:lysine--tRNA ligase [Pyrofollis japonicus]